MSISKEKQLQNLYEPYRNCRACPLGSDEILNIVFGEGSANAKIMIIGEGPGKGEDETGRPFIGRSGKLLTKALLKANINRESVFITNIVKCRPPKNRNPRLSESSICKNLLLFNQIKIIQPKIICTLGAQAMNLIIKNNDPTIKISKVRGQIFYCNNIPVVPIYHPAYILRNNSKLNVFLDDIKLLKKLSEQSSLIKLQPE